MKPLETVLNALKFHNIFPKRTSDPVWCWQSLCPAHKDNDPSLSIGEDQDGHAMVKCFAGCSTDQVLSSIGLTKHDLRNIENVLKKAEKAKAKKENENSVSKEEEEKELENIDKQDEERNKITIDKIEKQVLATSKHVTTQDLAMAKNIAHEYLLELGLQNTSKGVLIPYHTHDGKEYSRYRIRWGASGHASAWSSGTDPLIPYGLKFLNEYNKETPLYIVEGESDCWTLWSHSYQAIGIPGSSVAKNTNLAFLSPFKKIFIVQEPDKAGSRFVQHCLDNLIDLSCETRVIIMAETEFKDPNEIVKKHPFEFSAKWNKLSNEAVDPTKQFPGDTSDFDNAHRFIRLFGDMVRWVPTMQAWYRFDGKLWRRGVEHVGVLVEETVAHMRKQAERIPGDAGIAVCKAVDRCKTAGKTAATLAIAANHVHASEAIFDAHPGFLNCLNGTYDLDSCEFRGHTREDFITKTINSEYKHDEMCPNWIQFLKEVIPDADMRDYLRRAAGYSLSGYVDEQCLFILYGTGANGKSVFQETLRGLWGDYSARISPYVICVGSGRTGSQNANPEVARLPGTRLAMTSEVNENLKFNEGEVKTLTGGEVISTRNLFSNTFEFKPEFKIWLGTNHKPQIRSNGHAIWRRIHLIPFEVTIDEDRQDKDLVKKLKSEYAGILNWAISGFRDWRLDGGLKKPSCMVGAIDEYKKEQDVLGQFIEDCCSIGPLEKVGSTDLYNAYVSWTKENGEYCLSQRIFSQRIAERGFKKFKSEGRIVYLGIGVTTVWQSRDSGGIPSLEYN